MKKLIIYMIIPFLCISNSNVINGEDIAPDGFKNIAIENSGPYKTILQMSPPEPISGPVKFALIINEVNSKSPIIDAKVQFFAEPEKCEKQYTPGLNSPEFKNIYIGMLELDKPGLWTIEAIIKSSIGEGNIIVPIEIKKRSRGDNFIGGNILFVIVTIIFISIPLWLRRESKKALAKKKN